MLPTNIQSLNSMFQKCIHDLHMYIHFCDKLIIFLCVSCKNIIVGSRRFRLRYIRISERQFNEINALIHNKDEKNTTLYTFDILIILFKITFYYFLSYSVWSLGTIIM